MKCYQTLLSKSPTSGRGIKYRLLSPSERDEVLFKAARVAGPEATRQEMAVLSAREGAKAMLVAITDGPVKTLTGASWLKCDLESLNMPGKLDYNGIFSAKDDEILCGLYQHNHGVSQEDIEEISSKAEEVQEG
jgi:hypothetical protein